MLKDSFCSSPWYHLKISHDGQFTECRWVKNSASTSNFNKTSIMEFYNGSEMRELRTALLDGKKPNVCDTCYYEEQFGKLNGRIKQLNKSGIMMDHFDLSIRSSPHYEHFRHSNDHSGHSELYPVDLQIDLGNVCNSACIMCSPDNSSRLATDYNKLSTINPKLFIKPSVSKSWTQDPVLLKKFIDELVKIPNIKYIHFLGGETLYDPAFYAICDQLIANGVSKNIIVGTTTNGTIYDQRVESLIKQFKEFHLGISIESITELNDYVRYPGKISSILDNIDKFLSLRTISNLYTSLRITPNVLTIYELDLLVDYMMEKNIAAESCNILFRPAQLKVELLPEDIRQEIIDKLDLVIDKYKFTKNNVVNIRKHDVIAAVIADTTLEYREFLDNYTAPKDVEELRYQLVDYLKAFESVHNNSILDYAPRYKDFLRSYGY